MMTYLLMATPVDCIRTCTTVCVTGLGSRAAGGDVFAASARLDDSGRRSQTTRARGALEARGRIRTRGVHFDLQLYILYWRHCIVVSRFDSTLVFCMNGNPTSMFWAIEIRNRSFPLLFFSSFIVSLTDFNARASVVAALLLSNRSTLSSVADSKLSFTSRYFTGLSL